MVSFHVFWKDGTKTWEPRGNFSDEQIADYFLGMASTTPASDPAPVAAPAAITPKHSLETRRGKRKNEGSPSPPSAGPTAPASKRVSRGKQGAAGEIKQLQPVPTLPKGRRVTRSVQATIPFAPRPGPTIDREEKEVRSVITIDHDDDADDGLSLRSEEKEGEEEEVKEQEEEEDPQLIEGDQVEEEGQEAHS